MADTLITLAVLAMATSAVAVTLTRASLFSGLRVWARAKLPMLIAKLLACSYCASHWIAAALVAVYQPVTVRAWLPLDLCVSVMLVVWLSSQLTGITVMLTHFRPDPDLEDH